ncbi:SDR family oxidoreductase [Halococcus sp. IIIV-5B]|uniref:SDR family oxidoreductase n=1 Tax=Halococcus sp. IIIV-5B TaxID=2321230 RepID=UPI001F437616|nr:SDR family oxidoreductase [Halococcus sp. IIIV-5B]
MQQSNAQLWSLLLSVGLDNSLSYRPENSLHMSNDKSESDSQFESNTDLGDIALVTGANKGIGYETARQLGEHGMRVIASARDEQRGEDAIEELREDGVDAQFVQLDVTDESSIKAATQRIESEFGHLDVLVNNAGVYAEDDASGISTEVLQWTYEANVFGAVAVTRAMLPLLRQSPAGRIVNVSSPLGSMAMLSDEEIPIGHLETLSYCSSKAALNAITAIFANELHEASILVNAVSPGYVATDLNDYEGENSPEEGARASVEAATLSDDGPTGQFFSNHDPTGHSLSDDGKLPW